MKLLFFSNLKANFVISSHLFHFFQFLHPYRAKGINKIYKFDSKNPPQRRSTLVYFIAANLITFKYVLDQIHSITSHQHIVRQLSDMGTKPFHIIVLPTVLHSFDVVLEEEGLFGFVELHRFNWDFITIDTGALTLEIPQVYREVFIRGDTSLLPSIAQSLRILNMVCRRTPIVLTFGENAGKIANMIDTMEVTRSDNKFDDKSDFNTMIIMDRNKDYASALMTPVVYSGLLLELFHSVAGTLQITEHKNRIQCEKLPFIKSTVDKTEKLHSNGPEAVKNLRLSDTVDGIYFENRYKHFSEATNLLSNQAKALGMEGRNIQGMEITEMHEFVAKKLPKVATQKKELFKHLLLCENIVNELGGNFEKLQFIEESMLYTRNKKQTFQKLLELLTTDAHRYNSLRYICLLHLTCGLNAEESSTFMTNYLNAFGYQYLPVFSHLASAKLFPDLPNLAKTKILTNISLAKWQNPFQIEANRMKLLPLNIQTDQTDDKNSTNSRRDPTCSSYVFNGSYVPVIAQLANALMTAHKIDDFAEKFGHCDQIQLHRCFQHSKISIKEMVAGIKHGEYGDIFPLRPRNIFCFIVGGVTYAELAAINLVEKLTGSKIIVASDRIASGSDFIEAAFN